MSDSREEPLLGEVDEQTPVNPFLSNLASAQKGPPPKGPPPPRKVAPPVAEASADSDSRPTARPRRVAKRAEYELRAQPGAESPNIKDAHSEFRRGGLGKTLAYISLAALILGGLTWLVKPEEKKAIPFEKLYAPPKQEPFAIGTSLPPDRIAEPEIRQMPDKLPDQRKADAPPRPEGIVTQKQFADEFKANADKTGKP